MWNIALMRWKAPYADNISFINSELEISLQKMANYLYDGVQPIILSLTKLLEIDITRFYWKSS